MNAKFRAHIRAMEPSYRALISMKAVAVAALPASVPTRGVYLFSEDGRHLYVGRSNRIRGRLQDHCRPGSNHNKATFAFRIARAETGFLTATYSTEGSRSDLERKPGFAEAFIAAKARIKNMDVRFVKEAEPMRQALLEMYVALSLETPYNDFENH